MYRPELAAIVESYRPFYASAILVTVIALASNLGTASLQQTAAMMLVDMVLVIGLYTFVGNSGILSFGHVSFMGIGAYAAALLTIPIEIRTAQLPDLPLILAQLEMSTVPAVVAAAAFAAVFGFVVAIPLMRLSGLPASIGTFSLLLVVYTVIKQWHAVTAGPSVLGGMPLDTDVASALGWVIFAMAISYAFQISRSGRRLRASREDNIAASAAGVHVIRDRVAAFTISAFIFGIGGALYGHLLGSFDSDAFYLRATLLLMVMLVFGGTNSLTGAVLGTVTISAVMEILRQLEPGFQIGPVMIPAVANLRELGLGAILVIVLALFPGGLTGNREFVFRWGAPGPWYRNIFGHPRAQLPTALESTAPPKHGEAHGDARLTAKDIGVRYGGVAALDGVDLSLGRGEILGLIGPNGAGKTTLINVLTGYQRPNRGSIRLLGRAATGWTPDRLTSIGLARTFQNVRLFSGLSVFENVAVPGLGIGLGSARAARQAVDLLNWLGVENKIDTMAAALSHAEARLVAIARALAVRPAFLLLDEPAAGMSEEESERLARLLKAILAKYECGILIVEHNMRLVMEVCQRIQVIDQGRTISLGTPQHVRTDPAVIEAYLGYEHEGGDAGG